VVLGRRKHFIRVLQAITETGFTSQVLHGDSLKVSLFGFFAEVSFLSNVRAVFESNFIS
jgi:hypothetical protein